MSYFPILTAPFCSGRTTIYNFPPNNWENLSKPSKLVNLTWSAEGIWHSVTIDELSYGMAKSYTKFDIPTTLPDDILPLLSLSSSPFPECSEILPSAPSPNQLPTWRASLELFSESASTSYQGELDPFPEIASLLSFPPILQTHATIKNFLLFLNLEKSPVTRAAHLEIFRSSDTSSRLDEYKILNNSITCIGLDSLDIQANDLPLFVSKNMSGVPLFFAMSDGCTSMSLEHTHPPASYVIHGKRWDAQKYLKIRWGSRLDNK